ncbi:MAG: hypothetical protein H0U92_13555 [Actinobacteria bacterium]|nr:hypothetical protein [Actinomycetota bacterium]
MSRRFHLGAYRTLVGLYPPRFRDEYGDDMAFLFEEMLADRPAASVWGRAVVDAITSIPLQRLESVMSARPNPRNAGAVALVSFAVAFVALASAGTNPAAVVGITVVGVALGGTAAIYWSANRGYVEPADRLHQRWYQFLGFGLALLALLAGGSELTSIELPWELLVGTLLTGWALTGLGVLLGLWHAIARMRPRAVSS